ncbi:NAD(P)H-hydrate dehydratase [Ascidiimonas aurantiaca]|uniref:NAD(P)H-hydrate dehydratase n=1 Tax=Ascidiimonas aurantiaca TaxID=1685432 RepID=UPI0030EEF58D
MKIFSTEQIYQADKFTIEDRGMASAELMESAGKAVFDWLHGQLKGAKVIIHVFCGIGNNGGDGMVIARYLLQQGYTVNLYIVNFSDQRAADFLLNLKRIKDIGYWPEYLDEHSDLPSIGVNDVVIDAIFGIGLNRKPDAWVSFIMQNINTSGAFILSVDIPSGLFMNAIPESSDHVILADHILSFQVPKLPFFLPDNALYVKNWEVIDIGLSQKYMKETQPLATLIDTSLVLSFYRSREKFTHKGTYGHTLVIGGSYGKIGACLLAGKASLVSGAGRVSLYLPKCGYLPAQTALPEIMVETDLNEHYLTEIATDIKPDAVALGMGIGLHADTVRMLESFLSKTQIPLVLDADALTILSQNPKLLTEIPAQSILTPHPQELRRLIGEWKDDFEKIARAQAFANTHKIILVIKGAHTLILHNTSIFVNNSGNPGMATAGSGDVLSGIIAGLMSQGYAPLEAAVFGVFLHGRAGDISASQKGYEALTAGSITDCLGEAFLSLFPQKKKREKQTSSLT